MKIRIGFSLIVSYWKKVFTRSFQEVWDFFEIRGLIVNAIAAAIVYGVLWYGTDFQDFLAGFEDQGIIIFWIVVLFMPLLTLLNSVTVSARLYNELGGFDENPLTVTALPKKPLANTEVWASVKIENTSDHRVENCTLTLERVLNIENQNILRTSERLTWSGRDQQEDDRGDKPKAIIGHDWKICDVAQTQNNLNRIIFTLWFNNNQIAPTGNYIAVIKINGEWIHPDGTRGFEEEKRFNLEYNGGFDLSLSEVT